MERHRERGIQEESMKRVNKRKKGGVKDRMTGNREEEG